MSEVGQSRNHYHRMRRFTERLDSILRQDNQASELNELGRTIKRIAQYDFQSIDEMVFYSLAIDLLGLTVEDLKDLADDLALSKISENSRLSLSRLSKAFHDESVTTLNRLRSSR